MSFVLGVDIGTSRIRCIAVDQNRKVLAQCETPIKIIHSTPDGSELDPKELWENFKKVIHETLYIGNLSAGDAACLGITVMRNTFLLWEKESGKPLCNFSTWQDCRAAKDCIDWNESLQLKLIRTGSNIAHFFTRSKRFFAAGVISFITNMVAPRLWWLLNKMDGMRERARRGEICFGTVDTWIIWKLTGGSVHATDYSNISGTGIFDPYIMDWSGLLLKVFDIPRELLPEIRDTNGHFGYCSGGIFGATIPITGIISDQTSAMFAQMCWDPGDIKCTLGTGMFIDVNTGGRPHASITGFYPIIGWKLGDDLTFLAEGMFSSVGSVIEWGKKFGLYADPEESETIATSVDSSNGVCFVPCFSGIQAPYNDPTSTGSIIGINHTTTKEHTVRALLESVAFICKQLFDVASSEVDSCKSIGKVRVDGGVCNNGFILQLMSDLVEVPVQKPTELDMTVYGAVYVAGLGSGFWESREKIRSFWQLDNEFIPNVDNKEQLTVYKQWQNALQRSLKWYPQQ